MKKLLHRAALLVRAKEPFVHWANHLDIKGPRFTADLQRETQVYLVPELDGDPDGSFAIQQVFEEIFECELGDWHTDPGAWPQVRDLATFLDWFDVEVVDMVTDLDEGALTFDALD